MLLCTSSELLWALFGSLACLLVDKIVEAPQNSVLVTF